MAKRRSANAVARPNQPGGARNATVKASYFHSGPLPDPRSLERYEEVVPGAAERIIILAEKQAAHRQKIESRVVWVDGGLQTLGMILYSALFMAAAFAGTYLILHDKDVQGLATMFGAIAGPLLARRVTRDDTSKK